MGHWGEDASSVTKLNCAAVSEAAAVVESNVIIVKTCIFERL